MTATVTTARPETCPACVADPKAARGRYCARFRCYCAHPECPAAASYVHRRPRLELVKAPAVPPRKSSAWDTREESTWIDSM